MANPNNIILRSEKGSFITFEEMDLNLIELRDLITEFNTFLTTSFSNVQSSFNQIQTDWSNFQIAIDDRVVIVEQDINDINSEQLIQNNRLDSIESNSVLKNANNIFGGQNQFDDLTIFNQIVTFNNDAVFESTNAIKVPVGTEAQRTGTPAVGLFRYNSDTNSFEGYSNTGWGSIGGGATGGVGSAAFWENDITITQNYTITAGKNAGTFGPVTVADGVSVTVPAGSTWSIV